MDLDEVLSRAREGSRDRLRRMVAGPAEALSRLVAAAPTAEDPDEHRAALRSAADGVGRALADERDRLEIRRAELRSERRERAFRLPASEAGRLAHELAVDRAIRRLESRPATERQATLAEAAVRGGLDARLLLEAARRLGSEAGEPSGDLELLEDLFLDRADPEATSAVREVEAQLVEVGDALAMAAGAAGALVEGAEAELPAEPTFAAKVRRALAPPEPRDEAPAN